MIVSRNELGDALGITPIKVSALANQGIFTTVARGKYNLPDCVQKFIEISVEHLLKKSQSSTPTERSEESLQYWKMVRAKNAALKEMGIPVLKKLSKKQEANIAEWLQDSAIIPVNYPDETSAILQHVLRAGMAVKQSLLQKKTFSQLPGSNIDQNILKQTIA